MTLIDDKFIIIVVIIILMSLLSPEYSELPTTGLFKKS